MRITEIDTGDGTYRVMSFVDQPECRYVSWRLNGDPNHCYTLIGTWDEERCAKLLSFGTVQRKDVAL